MNINAKVAHDKRKHPGRFCPRHRQLNLQRICTVLEWIRNGYQFPSSGGVR
jgi:hypothetical protein